ncbi:cyclase/dehydrase [Truepera radiovictrix DSM 17093]|uniref:Cyclase/dehydrase n=1 Tax=Truepera radiovictrix (strain DSM 17093 / CIP 108686 / LMG 22925 / RQ-24) TaxID=649638 RepID=D7CTK6_TRURR|nr:cyclase/dehydrase [Truepera radiovictrix DSM 17093]
MGPAPDHPDAPTLAGDHGAGDRDRNRRDQGGKVTLLVAGAALVGLGVAVALGARARSRTPNDRRIRIEQHVTINRSPEELYRVWRNLEGLPQIMRHLESVSELTEGRSRWTAKAPLGQSVSWEAEITQDLPGQIIAWRSLAGADVKNAGSVSFTALPGARGTDLKVVLAYEPPAGKVGAALAKLFGEEPEMQLREDLRRFKQRMETGEVATTEGQPSGRA